MPHKHKRKGAADPTAFNLPPSSRAQPLATGKPITTKPSARPSHAIRKESSSFKDDIPYAFRRVLAFQSGAKRHRDLDDGGPRKTKRRKDDGTAGKAPDKAAIPRIEKGERLADFAARVNQALPIAGLARKGLKAGEGGARQTRLEKKIKRKIDEWHKQEGLRKDREQEALDEAEEAESDERGHGKVQFEDVVVNGKRKKKGSAITTDKDEEDPWEKLRHTREKPKGLHDVVQAPPQFTKLPREIFKVKNGARVDVSNVPTSAGSLRRREELGLTRQSVIDQYREMIAGRKSMQS